MKTSTIIKIVFAGIAGALLLVVVLFFAVTTYLSVRYLINHYAPDVKEYQQDFELLGDYLLENHSPTEDENNKFFVMINKRTDKYELSLDGNTIVLNEEVQEALENVVKSYETSFDGELDVIYVYRGAVVFWQELMPYQLAYAPNGLPSSLKEDHNIPILKYLPAVFEFGRVRFWHLYRVIA